MANSIPAQTQPADFQTRGIVNGREDSTTSTQTRSRFMTIVNSIAKAFCQCSSSGAVQSGISSVVFDSSPDTPRNSLASVGTQHSSFSPLMDHQQALDTLTPRQLARWNGIRWGTQNKQHNHTIDLHRQLTKAHEEQPTILDLGQRGRLEIPFTLIPDSVKTLVVNGEPIRMGSTK